MTRVPLFVKYPNNNYGGRNVDRPVDSTNLMPTILEVLDIDLEMDYSLQGSPLLSDGSVNKNLNSPLMQTIDWHELDDYTSASVQGNRKTFINIENGDRQIESYELTGPQLMGRKPVKDSNQLIDEILSRLKNYRNFQYSPHAARLTHEEQLEGLGYI